MKDLMLCLILMFAGTLTQTIKPDTDEMKIDIFGRCPRLCFTPWFDRDDPSGNGDYETLKELRAEYPRRICNYPCFIQAQTLNGIDAAATGQVFAYYDTVNGFACVNAQQIKKRPCLDYKVRFACLCSLFIRKESDLAPGEVTNTTSFNVE